MLYGKRRPLAVLGLLFAVPLIFFFICGCAKNEADHKSDYEDILNEAAYGQAPTVAEIVPSTISFAQNGDEKPKTEAPPPALETPEIARSSEDIEDIEAAGQEGEVLFVVTQSGKKYHLQSCYMVKSIKQYLTRQEAEQSKYEPCKICNPH